MNRIGKHIAAGTALLGLGIAALSACVHDDSTLFIRNVLSPPTIMAGATCTFTADPTQTYISGGTLDIDFRTTYDAVFLVGNQMVPQGDPTKPATETSRIQLKGAIVKITDTSGNKLTEFSEATSGTVDPLSGSNPSFLPAGATLVDVATVASLLPTISQGPLGFRPVIELDTHIRFFGYTLGGQYVESGDFEFPVDVCKGCLINFSSQSENPNFPAPNCLGSGTGTSQSVSVPCILENTAIDCSLCAGSPDPSIRADCNPNANSAPLDAGAG